MNQLTIQPITNANDIIKILHAAFKRYEFDPIPSSALAETPETIKENLANGTEVFGASVGNELVGIMKVTQQQQSLYFSRLSVLPSHQNQGIASALVNHLNTIADERDLIFVQCKVRRSEQENIRLYKKLGYHIISEEITMSPTGFAIETVTMQKAI